MGQRARRRGVTAKVDVVGTIAKVTSLARGGVAVTIHFSPSKAKEAYRAGAYIDKAMRVELREVNDGVD